MRSEPARHGALDAVARARDLLVYSVSGSHIEVRERLAIAVDS